MARSLAGEIEEYLKAMLLHQSFIELQRGELADVFSCVPSQINYVLGTRFTPAQGYVVESRRGGGGYLKIVKLDINDLEDARENTLPAIEKEEGLTESQAEGVLNRLLEESIITSREAHILKACMDRHVLMGIENENIIRSRMLIAAVNALYRSDN